jgi:transcriptional regulator with GAF, ATPase, and Fis domain
MQGRDDPARAEVLAGLAGASRAMAALRADLAAVAATDSSLLLTGETGTGKGLAARVAHRLSPRAERPFVQVDCAALAPTLVESELFGHERGAFTGAEARHAGRFELAGDGTVFLDEIGDLEPRLQSKLLRVLDDRRYERLGGVEALPMRARIVAATSHDLRRAVREGRFRPDLYYRLAVFHLVLPPLRERLEDLPALVSAGIERVARRLAIPRPLATESFHARLAEHAWPGNVRELVNTLERVLVRTRSRLLTAADLDGVLEPGLAPPAAGAPAAAAGDAGRDGTPAPLPGPVAAPATLREILSAREAAERSEILEALRATRGNVNRAAERLRLARGTLRYRMQKYGIDESA